MRDLVTLGESMLRLSPLPGEALEHAQSLRVFVGGAESNVAVTLSRLGRQVGWVSRLVDDPLGRRIAAAVRSQRVDVSAVIWTGEGRTGLYFLEPGVPPRPTRVVYDRRHSAMASIHPDMVDWSYVRSARCLHLTGITPALSAGCLDTVRRAIAEARSAGVRISFDVNYRAGLWSPDQASRVLGELAAGVDAMICSQHDADLLFDAPADPEDAAVELARKFRVPMVTMTLGAQGALAWVDGRTHRQEAVRADPLDPIGRGDAFAAGFLHGYLAGDIPAGLRGGVKLAALCQSYLGDIGWVTTEDLDAPDDSSRRVQR